MRRPTRSLEHLSIRLERGHAKIAEFEAQPAVVVFVEEQVLEFDVPVSDAEEM